VADQDRGSDDPRLSAAARHALHDEELVAAFAAGDIDDPADADRARSFVDRCGMCRELHDDLRQIRRAVQASGTAAQRAASVAAPRDFRLTAQDAAQLRPGSPVVRVGSALGWRGRLGRGVASFGRPLGAGLATLGIAGLLIGSLTLAGSPFSVMVGGAASASSAPPAVDQTVGAPEQSERSRTSAPGPTTKNDGAYGGPSTPAGGAGVPSAALLIGGSVAVLVAGIGLVIAARRPVAPISARRGN
jgi:hypothetical protein